MLSPIFGMMIVGLIFLAIGGWIGFSIYASTQIKEKNRKRAEQLVRLEVTVPKTETEKDMDLQQLIGQTEQLFTSLYSIYSGKASMTQGQEYFGLEISAYTEPGSESMQIVFYFLVPPAYQTLFEDQITAYFGNANIDVIPDFKLSQVEEAVSSAAYVKQVRSRFIPIKTYVNLTQDPLNSMLNAFTDIKSGEAASVQLMLRPVSNKWITQSSSAIKRVKDGKGMPSENVFIRIVTGIFEAFATKKKEGGVELSPMKETQLQGMTEKQKKLGFECTTKVVTSAADKNRSDQLLTNITAAFSQFQDPNMNSFRIVKSSEKLLYELYNKNRFDLPAKPMLLNVEELASLVHMPHMAFNDSPGIKWSAFKQTPPPQGMLSEGILLGNNVYRGKQTTVKIGKDDRTRHFYVIGKSGSGKSVFLEYCIRQDIMNGDGVCVIDPHGDLAQAVLPYVPPHRAKDVVYFDPADEERPMGLNLLEAAPDQRELVASEAMQIFIKLFGAEIFGPRIQHYFRNGALTLMEDEDEGATIIDVPRLFVDDAFLQSKLKKVKNPVVKAFWEKEYAKTGDREKQEMIPFFSSKFGPFVTNSIIRNIIGQSKSAFNVRKIMDEQKIFLVSLSKGKIGEQNMKLLGLILVAQIQMAAMSRVDIPAKQRKDFYLYVDEFQNFATDSFASILSEARKYRLALIVAHQYITQLEEDIRDAVFGNVGSMMSFKVGANDAEYMAKEYTPVYDEKDILGISNYKAYIKLCINNATSNAFSMDTIYDPEGKNEELGKAIRQVSRLLYGRDKKYVDLETMERTGGMEIFDESLKEEMKKA